MKEINCIIKPSKLEDVKKALSGANIVGMTVREVRGYGRQRGFVNNGAGADTLVNLLPKYEIEIVAGDEDVEKVIGVVSAAARTGEPGDGKIFISEILDAVRISTGERGTDVI